MSWKLNYSFYYDLLFVSLFFISVLINSVIQNSLKRILFLWSCQNETVKYFQGASFFQFFSSFFAPHTNLSNSKAWMISVFLSSLHFWIRALVHVVISTKSTSWISASIYI
jgi:hypothetical protein